MRAAVVAIITPLAFTFTALAVATTAECQSLAIAPAAVTSPHTSAMFDSTVHRGVHPGERSLGAVFPDDGWRGAPTWMAPAASLVVPGAGQFMLRNERFLAYVAVEALGWWKYVKDIQDRARQEASYKDLARRVARAQFSKELPDADWLYYEWMRDRIESGRYSVNVTGPVVPETDTSTYNGSRWVLALSTNPNPAAALAQYEREAIRPEFRWSWRNAQLQYDIYKRTTDKRNDAAHAAVQDLLVLGANHVLSMVDAFASIRLQARTLDRGGTALGATVRW